MVEEEWYETTRMVAKHTEKENIEKVYSHTNPFIRNFIRRSIKGGRVSANRKSFETNKMDEICNVLKEYISQTESNNIIDLFKEYSASTKDKTEVHSRLKKIECTKLMAFDANGLYASAMSDLDSEYPRAESGRPFLPEEEKEFVMLFNKQKFRPRTAILTVWFDYPKNIDLRNKYKREGNIVGSNCMKLLGNSLYGKSIQKDLFTTRHLWNEATLQANFDSPVKTYEKINDTQYIVETEIEEKEITTEDSKSTRLTPSHLGSFVLSHSKKIMNNFIHIINGFYKPEIYYTDTDSLYISSKNWKKLNRAGLVSEKDYCKGKNDYGDGGIIFGLYLAPKVKYNIVLTSDGVLKEKKTFKGYSNDKISVEDYVQLASGHDVSNEFNKPWEKSFTNGVVIPNDKQTTVFRSYLNNVKRKPPNSEGIMYPYNDKDEYSFDENYEFDDFDYLSNQEENEDCFK
ncbi:hypothetical protein LOTGIDRAFT_153390 [Lottia gigantea]|uniref:DNA-directed DNA polymerase n=1 Tax=Lottia gigantea TaxID=225164 RepID=V4AAW3_LOTGI|nr:hypothetical protein LOTGIDRAFT_153390 [Lottia gigantea]ESO93917.1 hypothetical protein LOTGIDRAFT_153390 [Lottia gigantea]